MSKDFASIKTFFEITKYKTEEGYKNGNVHKVSKFEKNLFLTEGVEKLWNLIAGIDGSGYFSESNAYIGVGDGTTSEAEGQTALQGSNKFYSPMDSGYPTVSGDTITFYSTFGGSEANFDWQEFTIANGGSDGDININRKVDNQGTKVSGAVWEFKVELQIT